MPCKICKRFLSGVLWPAGRQAGRTPFKFVGDTRNAMVKEEGRKQIPAMLKFNIQWIYSFLLKHPPPPLISIIEWCSMGRRGRPSNTLIGWGRYYTENIPSLVSFNIIFDKKKKRKVIVSANTKRIRIVDNKSNVVCCPESQTGAKETVLPSSGSECGWVGAQEQYRTKVS